ncbi:MAG: cation transporter [Muribaculaceae bacterium]|nr:cation transporter [Muribaculaceae bacterium]
METTSENRSQLIIRTSLVGIAANVLLATFKAVVGLIAGSVAVVMDAVNNLSDALSSVITIVGTKLSQRPADLEHPFGHGRVEYFSAIVIAIIVLSAGATSLIESVKKVFDPTAPHYTATTLIVIVASIVVKLVLGRYVKRQGEQLKSDALIASGADALFDAIITLATLVSAGVMLLWNVSLDGILGTLISLIIIKAGIDMLSSPINELLGSRFSPELVSQIKSEVMAFDGVQGVFDLILHNYGPNVMMGSLHINVPDTMSAHDIHRLTRHIAEAIYERHAIILTVGIYAVATGTNLRAQQQKLVTQTIAAHPEVLQVHGFLYDEDEHRISVDVVPDVSVKDEAQLAQMLKNEVQPLLPDDQLTIIIDHNYSA